MSNNQQPVHNMASSPELPPTPSEVPTSRASTVVRGSSERSAQSPGSDKSLVAVQNTPDLSGTGRNLGRAQSAAQSPEKSAIDDFRPFQLLMETELTIEYGKNLKTRKVIHQELMCCHSQKAQNLYKKAKIQREAYSSANEMRKKLKEYTAPYMSEKAFEEQHIEKLVIPQITRIYDQYPLTTYRTNIQKRLDTAIAEQVEKKHIIASGPKSAIQKKELKDMGIHLRLLGLSSKGVLAVTERLSSMLRNIKRREKEDAKSDKLKAAVQQRIILPNTEERVVRSLMHWTYYRGALMYEDPEHLYALHTLAEELGMTQLHQQCLSKLLSDAEDMMQHAFSQGLTLRRVLGFDTEATEAEQLAIPPGNVVEVVFQHVLKDEVAPKKLVNLVVDALARHLEPSLWLQLQTTVNSSMSSRLIEAMLHLRQVKTEHARDSSVKSESASTGDEYAVFAPIEQT